MTYPRHAKPATGRTLRGKPPSYWVKGDGTKAAWGWGYLTAFAALPMLALLIVISTPWAVGNIEDKAFDESQADLTAAGIDTAGLEIDFDYRDGEATGQLPPGVDAATAEAAVDHNLIREFDVLASTAPSPEPTPEPTETPLVTGSTEVQASAADGRIVLAGEVLTTDQRDLLAVAATDLVSAANVDDQLQVSGLRAAVDGADARVADLAEAIAALGAPGPWTAELTDTSLAITATVADGPDVELLNGLADSLTAVPTTVDVTVSSSAIDAEVEALQAELDDLTAEVQETVVFGFGSEELSGEATATLDKVVVAMNTYPLPVVEVAGHTDSIGTDEQNQTVSQARAEAVVAYLESQGIAPERLDALGVGEAEPIDNNDTEEGRARNRRVELTALEAF